MRLQQWVWNRGALSPFVRISVNCSWEDTNCTESCWRETLSRTKWTSTSICLVFWCWTGLKDKAMADRLSQNRTGTPGNEMCRKANNCLIQSNSAEVKDKARYSASMEDRETVYCFLEDHEMGLLPKKTTKPVVDLLSLGSPAQSASLNAFNCKSPRVYEKPNLRVPFRYRRCHNPILGYSPKFTFFK